MAARCNTRRCKLLLGRSAVDSCSAKRASGGCPWLACRSSVRESGRITIARASQGRAERGDACTGQHAPRDAETHPVGRALIDLSDTL